MCDRECACQASEPYVENPYVEYVAQAPYANDGPKHIADHFDLLLMSDGTVRWEFPHD